MKNIVDITPPEYKKLKESGLLCVLYPDATGEYYSDTNIFSTKNSQESSVEPYVYYDEVLGSCDFKSENTKEKHGHYFKHWNGKLDPYRICDLFEVNDAAISHAVKKLLCTGNRGHKDFRKDIEDVIDTLERKLEMIDEDEVKS